MISSAIAVKNDLILLEYLVSVGALLEASDEKERKEFTKNGKLYRVTAYDSDLGRRVSVPFAEVENAPVNTDAYFDFGAIISLVSSGVEAVREFLDNSFGKGAREFRSFLADQWKGLGDSFTAIANADPFPEVTAQAKKLVGFLRDIPEKVLSPIQQNKVVKELTAIVKAIHDKYTGAIYDLSHLEGPTWKKVLGKVVAFTVPVMAGVAIGVLTETCIAMFASGLLYGAFWSGVALPVAMSDAYLYFRVTKAVALYRAIMSVKDSYGAIADTVKVIKQDESKWYEKAGMLALGFGLTLLAVKGLDDVFDVKFTPLYKSPLTRSGKAVGETLAKGPKFVRDELTLRKEMLAVKKHLAINAQKWQKMSDEALSSGVPKNVLAHTEDKVKRIRDGLLLDNPRHVKDLSFLMDAADKNLEDIFNRSSIHMRINSNHFKSFARSEVKNNAQILEEGGGLVRTGAYDTFRRVVEEIHFGLPPHEEGLFRPVYGYFAHEGNHAAFEGAATAHYGNVVLKFKPKTKERALIIAEDSFPATQFREIYVSTAKGSPLQQYIDRIGSIVKNKQLSPIPRPKEVDLVFEKTGRGIAPANKPSSLLFFGLRDTSLAANGAEVGAAIGEFHPFDSNKLSLSNVSSRLREVATAKDLNELRKVLGANYVEANIFDGVSIDDVEKVVLSVKSSPMTDFMEESFVSTLSNYFGKVDAVANKFFHDLPPVPASVLPKPPPIQRYSQARIMQERRAGNYDFPEYFQPPYDAIALEKQIQAAKEDWLRKQFDLKIRDELDTVLTALKDDKGNTISFKGFADVLKNDVDVLFFSKLRGIPVEVD